MTRSAVDVVLLTTGRPSVERLEAIAETFAQAGVTARMVVQKSLRPGSPFESDAICLEPAAGGWGPAFRRRAHAAEGQERFLLLTAEHPEASEATRTAKALFPLDDAARWAADALAGDAAVATTRGQVVKLVKEAREARAAPGRPGRWLRGRVEALRGHSRTDALGTVWSTRRLRRMRESADRLGDLVSAELAAGVQSELAIDAYAAELACADAAMAAGSPAEAAQSVAEAARTAFHRTLHHDGLTSPLAEDPAGFLRPWHDSAAARQLAAPRGRSQAAATPPSGRPLRLLIATGAGAGGKFLTEIRTALDAHPDIELRYVDVADDVDLHGTLRTPAAIADHVMLGDREVDRVLEASIRPMLDWADVMFIDWCSALAVKVTAIDPRDTRVIVRLHSFEAFSHWPHLVDFSRVDDLVFVSDVLADFTQAIVPALTGQAAPRMHVLTNAVDLARMVHPKPDAARFTVGLVGWWQTAKDPRWGLEVLRHLRARDDRYRMLLVGETYAGDKSQGTREYAAALQGDFDELGEAVQQIGHTDDIPGTMRDIGTILSTSVRESFHIALVEGAASGAVPVVRDWPYFAGRPHSARSLFPADWVVDSPEQAAERILQVTATPERWQEVGREASSVALRQWDWARVRPGYEELILKGR